MNTQVFLMLLTVFSIISGLVTEAIKKLMTDKKNLSYNIIAICVALIVGTIGCAIYYQLNGITFTVNNIIYILLMGFASGLGSMLGYDKIKQSILQIVEINQNK